MAVIAWGIQHANDGMANSGAPNPVPDPSRSGRYRGFRLGDTAALGAQLSRVECVWVPAGVFRLTNARFGLMIGVPISDQIMARLTRMGLG
jgi:hypothetical protein